MTRIAVLDGITLNPGDNPWTALDALGDVTHFDETTPDQLLARLKDIEIAVTNKVRIPGDAIRQLSDLKMIAVTATGYDCVDTQAARQRGIPVCNVPTYGTDSVAQYAFALLLELCHRIGLHDAAVRNGHWQECGAFSFWLTPQVELAGLTMGIIGFGRIGQRVGEIARAFGMRVLFFDHHAPTPMPPETQSASLDDLATQSDVITLHCGLNDSSRNMINAGFLARMKPNAMLINAARGGLVDEAALKAALNAGRIAGAAFDVASIEPIRPDNPLLSAENCLLTPHMAWSTLSARKRMMRTVVDNVRNFLSGQPTNVVNGPAPLPQEPTQSQEQSGSAS